MRIRYVFEHRLEGGGMPPFIKSFCNSADLLEAE